jgi:hypothetical protein
MPLDGLNTPLIVCATLSSLLKFTRNAKGPGEALSFGSYGPDRLN